jgi:hypothetical protein
MTTTGASFGIYFNDTKADDRASAEGFDLLTPVFWALSENLTERPLLRYFLHSLKREEPTLVTAIRLAGDATEVGGCGGAGLRLNWAGHGQRLDEGVGVSGIPGL